VFRSLSIASDQEHKPAQPSTADPVSAYVHRPIDLGLTEGKSLTFSPTAVMVPTDAPAIGGIPPSPPPAAIATETGASSPLSGGHAGGGAND